jgi:hypothetical protein
MVCSAQRTAFASPMIGKLWIEGQAANIELVVDLIIKYLACSRIGKVIRILMHVGFVAAPLTPHPCPLHMAGDHFQTGISPTCSEAKC